MLKLILASGNPHKAEEFKELIPEDLIEVGAAPSQIEVVEDGETFEENAFKKAKAFYDEFKVPVISDDSGLVVEALPNELGIYSARFGGEGLSFKEKNELLLSKLEGIPLEKRGAYFVCVLCVYLNPDEIFFFEGRVNGHIGNEILDGAGFGYDPVFMPLGVEEGKSLAQVPQWKQKHSHRANASQHLVKFFKERV